MPKTRHWIVPRSPIGPRFFWMEPGLVSYMTLSIHKINESFPWRSPFRKVSEERTQKVLQDPHKSICNSYSLVYKEQLLPPSLRQGSGTGVRVALGARSCSEPFCESSKQLCAETQHLEGLTSGRNEF